jgi:hypothetical protein
MRDKSNVSPQGKRNEKLNQRVTNKYEKQLAASKFTYMDNSTSWDSINILVSNCIITMEENDVYLSKWFRMKF